MDGRYILVFGRRWSLAALQIDVGTSVGPSDELSRPRNLPPRLEKIETDVPEKE